MINLHSFNFTACTIIAFWNERSIISFQDFNLFQNSNGTRTVKSELELGPKERKRGFIVPEIQFMPLLTLKELLERFPDGFYGIFGCQLLRDGL